MSTPRITLWTQPFQMAFRLSIRPFDDPYLSQQATNIQSSNYRYITITPGAFYILSIIAGRRMTEPARWILFDSLRIILNGDLRTQHPEKQDLLASTFGELLGAILLSQHLKGDIEIIRLLESNHGKMPDFFLIQTTATAQLAHVLECKGRVEDVQNVNNRATEYDLCREIRAFRDDAIEQVEKIKFSEAKVGARTIIRQPQQTFGISQLAATENVLISSVPDARIIYQCRSNVKFASRKKCSPRVTCKMCITNLRNRSQANVISVLHQREIPSKSSRSGDLLPFIAHYRAAQRAAWSRNDILFQALFNNFINRLSNITQQDIISSFVFMAITLIEAAILEQLAYAHIDLQGLRSMAVGPLQNILEQVNNDLELLYNANEEQTPSIRPIRQTEMPDPTSAALLADTITPTNLPSMEDDNEQQQNEEDGRAPDTQNVEFSSWYKTNSDIRQIFEFIANPYTKTKLLIGATIQGDYVYGSVQYEDDTTIAIYLTSAKMDYAALKNYVIGLITQIRPRQVRPIRWRKEYFQENSQGKFFIGESWDEYPYPHPTDDGLLGITTWLARDGRAEIIVRKRARNP